MKILAIQNRMGIGDMIIYLPFIEAISKKYNTKVDILVKENSKASEILKDDRYVGEIINYCIDKQNSIIFDDYKNTFKKVLEVKNNPSFYDK